MRSGLLVSIAVAGAMGCAGAGAAEYLRLAQNSPSWNPWQPNTSAQAPVFPAPPAAQAPAPPPQPVRTEIVRFENWVATCNDFAEGPKKRICTAQIVIQQQGTNQIILAWLVAINDSKQFVTALQTPTGVRLGPGVELQLEKVSKRSIPYETCDTGHCIASVVMDAAMMRDLTASTKAQLTVHAANGQILNFEIPIKGFDKASAQIRTAM